MSGRAMQRISLYFHRQMLAMIEECIRRQPPEMCDEEVSRSEWIREACRQRILAEARTLTEEGQP
jgi:metal-responsive CopG/Arc/MetJ family transcriptional regulator